jgi:hypothetical protein
MSGLWDWMFGTEDVRKAMDDRSYLDPASVTDPAKKEAAYDAARRVRLGDSLIGLSQGIGQAKRQGGSWGDILSGGATGFAAGSSGDQQLKQLYTLAQTKGALAQAKKHEAEAQYYAGGGLPHTVRDEYGRVHRLTPKGYVPVSVQDQEGYKGILQQLPLMPRSGGGGSGGYVPVPLPPGTAPGTMPASPYPGVTPPPSAAPSRPPLPSARSSAPAPAPSQPGGDQPVEGQRRGPLVYRSGRWVEE